MRARGFFCAYALNSRGACALLFIRENKTGVMNMRELKTELVKLSKLKPDTRNARLHDERNIEEIKRSLVDNEQYAPLIVQRSTGKILAGNGRYTAMKELDWQECYVTYIDCTDEEATKIALTDNRTSELAEWDFATLKDLMQELGPEPDVAGWSNEEIEDMFQMFSDGDIDTSADVSESDCEMLRCPECGHINEKRAFRYNGKDTE